MTAGEKQAANTSRETELRKAMSLSYLKTEPEKRESKAPKPENVAALREALLAVMGASTLPPAMEAAAEGLSDESGDSENERESANDAASVPAAEQSKTAPSATEPVAAAPLAPTDTKPIATGEALQVQKAEAMQSPDIRQPHSHHHAPRPVMPEAERQSNDQGGNSTNRQRDSAKQDRRDFGANQSQQQAPSVPEAPKKSGDEVSGELLKGIFDES